MSELPDPPAHVSIENIADAVDKFRGIGGSLLLGGENFTAGADTAAGGRDLSNALRPLEPSMIASRLATLARLEDILNDALQCQYRNMLVDHLPNPAGTKNPKENCRPIVHFSLDDGSVEQIDYVR